MAVIRYLPSGDRRHREPLLSIIVPFFNEEEVLASCHQRIVDVLDTLSHPSEIIYVDDGSDDGSAHIVASMPQTNHDLIALSLSRNFGKEAAMTAGIKAARGRAVIVIDADLQDPPELIPAMVEKWQQGYDVVDMQRRERHGENAFKRITASLFYKLINRLCDVPIPENVGDFRLIDRRVVNAINALPERTRFMKGLFAWPGFRRTIIQFDRDPRLAGTTKWNTSKLVHLAFEGITSFSTKPLRIATFAGLAAGAGALAMALVVLFKTLVWGEAVAGYPSMMFVILTLGSVQLLSIGLMGEYIGRLFIEAKQRPLYLIDKQTTKPAFQHLKDVSRTHADEN